MAIRFWEIYEETKEKYKLRILAGKNGMDNVIGWVHMLEDETIINRFSGEELAVTTGLKARIDGWLLHLVASMKKAESAGIIINTGMYLKQVPRDVIDWCEAHNFPLLEMPWEISITELTQEYCMRIMQQVRTRNNTESCLSGFSRVRMSLMTSWRKSGYATIWTAPSVFSICSPSIRRRKRSCSARPR